MNQPTPAIVSQEGVRRLPRWGLLLFCAIYVLAGFVGRDPWKRLDVTSFGYMQELAQGHGDWLAPGLLGQSAHFESLLPYWLGAAAIQLAPAGMAPYLAARLVYMGLLALTLVAAWYGIYYLARSPQAQPVSFAFGGEARPTDYARAIADGGLLALLACLGLAQQGHEVGPALAQLCFATCTLFGLAAMPYRVWAPALFGSMGMLGLTLSGAPALAVLLGALGCLVHVLRRADWQLQEAAEYELAQADWQRMQMRWRWWLAGMALLVVACVALATTLNLWRWRIDALPQRWVEWRNLGRMFLWFIWPVWPLALWTLWRWRGHWREGCPSRHIAIPLGMALLCILGAVLTSREDVFLLIGLPALAALAAFALPTFRRSAAALIDWFTLIFFSLAAGYLWFMWVAMQTGQPASPARLVLRRVPGYTPEFEWLPFVLALLATAGWLVLVRWRTMRLQPAIWKSMILPAGGVMLCWVLATTIWMHPLNYARSYAPVVQQITAVMRENQPPGNDCVQQYGLEDAWIAALQYHGKLQLSRERGDSSQCRWLLVDEGKVAILPHLLDVAQWEPRGVTARPTDSTDAVHIYARRSLDAAP